MFRKLLFSISLVLLAALVGNSWGASLWNDGGPDHLWKTANNWNPNAVPTSSDSVTISLVTGPTIDAGTTANALEIRVGATGGATSIMTMTGGTLTTVNWFMLGTETSTTKGRLDISGGVITLGPSTINGHFWVGFRGTGTVNMTGGTITVTNLFAIARDDGGAGTAVGHVDLHGGTITADEFQMRGTTGTGAGTMDITEGTLILSGDQTGLINGYVSNGWITAYGGEGIVVVDYSLGKTTVTAVGGYETAYNPSPKDDAKGVDPNGVLSWSPAGSAVSHDVYLGTDFNDVNDTIRLDGDADGSGHVDWNDVLIVTSLWLQSPVGSEPYADLNIDGDVNGIDFAIVAYDWKKDADAVFKGNRDTNSYDSCGLDLNTT